MRITPTKGRAIAAAVLASSLLLAGCGADQATQPASPGTETASLEGFPVTIQNCGRTLTFDAPPSRAYLSFQPVAEMFIGLGLADRAVGQVTPLIAPLPEQAADFERIPDVSSDSYFPPPREQMFELRPDFLLAYADFDHGAQDHGVTGLATLDDLEGVGAQAYDVLCRDSAGGNVEDLESAYRTMLDLGRIFGVSERAQQRVEQMRQQVADVRAKVAGRPPVKVLYYGFGTGPIGTAGGTGLVNELIELAGGENVFAGEQMTYFQASVEQVAATEPAVFMINSDTPGEGDAAMARDPSAKADYLYRAFPLMPASRDRRVFRTDYVTATAGWRFAQHLEDLARVLHPEAFS